jgi:response regulator of citrate/malate metabolism
MTTALDNMKNLERAFKNLADGYLVKPITKKNLVAELEKFNLAST